MWKRIGKECGRKYPRAPSVRLLWETAMEAVLEFLRDTRVGLRASDMAVIGTPEEAEGEVSEGEGGPP